MGGPVKVALTLDLDSYTRGLAAAKASADQSSAQIEGAMGKIADRVTARYLSAHAAVRLGEAAVRSFIATAGEMEKKGEIDDGQAITNLEKSISSLWSTFVKTSLETTTMRAGLGAIADAADWLTSKMSGFMGLLDGMGLFTRGLLATIEHLLAQVEERIGEWLEELGFKLTAFSESWGHAVQMLGVKMMLGSDELAKKAEEAMARVRADAYGESDIGGVDEADPGPSFIDKVVSVTDKFRTSWMSAFQSIGHEMRLFSKETGENAYGLSRSMGGALGDVFDSIQFAASVAEKAFQGSAAAALISRDVQFAVTGATAGVKSIQTFADGLDLAGDGMVAESSLKFLASAGYAAAAAAAGYAIAHSGGSSSATTPGYAQGSAIMQPGAYAQPNRHVTVNIQNAIGGEAFIRDMVIPEINSAVGQDVVVLSTYSGSSSRVDPGRYQAQ